MAKKVKKNEEIISQEMENNETWNIPTAEEVLDEIEEKIKEHQPDVDIDIEIVKLDENIQPIAEDFKDTSARLEKIVKENPTNLENALEKEMKKVMEAEEIVEKAIAEAENKAPKNVFSQIRNFESWWNGSNSGL